MSYEIRELTISDHEAYSAFVEPALVYYGWHYKSFLEALLNCNSQYLAATSDDRIRGVLPLMYLNHDDRRLYNALPFFGSHGDILASTTAAASALADAYCQLATSPSTIAATIIENPFAEPHGCTLPCTHTDTRTAQYTMINELDPDDGIMPLIDSTARRNVRKAIKAGVTVAVNNDCMQDLKRLHVAGMAAIGGTRKSDAFFDLLPTYFHPDKDYDIYVAHLDGEVIAALLILYSGTTVEYFVPATDEQFRKAQPLSLILKEAMENAAARGYKVWNWGGTWETQTGVYRFKRKWGAAEKHYRYFTQLNDLSIPTWSRARILQDFPFFYVMPFAALGVETEIAT